MKHKLIGSFARDSLYTLLGLVCVNAIAQVILYPSMRNVFGVEQYGRILTLLSVVNFAGAVAGTTLSNARLVARSRGAGSDNGPYTALLLIASALSVALSLLAYGLIFGMDRPQTAALYACLIVMTVAKLYSEVEFRLQTNYIGLLLFYLVIGAGYLAGLYLMRRTGEWPMALLLGECFGFLYVLAFGSIYRKRSGRESLTELWASARYLFVSQLFSSFPLYSDKAILMLVCGGQEVTVFYLCCMVGRLISLLTGALNSVIIGYLSKRESALSTSLFRRVFALVSAAVFALSFLCLLGSMLYVRLLYPAEYELARPFFYPANLAQILYFASGIFTTILLRYDRESTQTRINLIYLLLYLLLTVCAAHLFGLWGYTAGILAVNLFRYLFAAFLCRRRLRELEKGSV